jgi:CheY-like chemotaxis protein
VETVREILNTAGYATATAVDAFQGLRLVREMQPAVIVCDMVMPNMAGADLFRTLATDPATAKTPRVMISGRADADRSCAHAFLAKPFRAEDLLKTIIKATSRVAHKTELSEAQEPRWRG